MGFLSYSSLEMKCIMRMLPHYLVAGLMGFAIHAGVNHEVDSPEILRDWNTKIIGVIGESSLVLHENTNLLMGWKNEVYDTDPSLDVDTKPDASLEDDAAEIYTALSAFKTWLLVQRDRILINNGRLDEVVQQKEMIFVSP